MHLNPSASQSQTIKACTLGSQPSPADSYVYMLHLGGKGERLEGAVFLCGVGLHKCTYKSFIFVIYGTHIPLYDINTDQSINCTTSFPYNWAVVA